MPIDGGARRTSVARSTVTMDVVFFHGAGHGAYAADSLLAVSLARHLGDGYSVHIPELPEEDDPDDRQWLESIGETIDRAAAPVVVVGHSAGGYLLLKYLATERVRTPIAAICIIAAPFPGGDSGWTFEGFDLPPHFARHLPDGAPVFLYGSEDDEVVPIAHRELYAAAIPGASTRTTWGGHQLSNDLELVADDIRRLPLRDRPPSP